MDVFSIMIFPGGSDSKESACNSGDLGLIPSLGRSPGKGNGYPFQYSYPSVHGILQTRILGGLPCPPPGNLRDLEIDQAGSLPLAPPGKMKP